MTDSDRAVAAADVEYFDRGRTENPLFWTCFGGRPDFTDRVVLDLGCVHGSLCLDIASAGARRVIGLDLNPALIEFATQHRIRQTNWQWVGGLRCG